MARACVVLLLTLALAGCTDGNAPPQLVFDLGADLAVQLDLPPGSCATACDCPAGQACQMGTCTTLAAPVFCCTSSSCSGTSICEFTNGMVSQCDRLDGGTSVTPVVDGSAPATQCEMTRCSRGLGGDIFCRLACGLAATCVNTGGIDHCMP
jgi:hypothetical protein